LVSLYALLPDFPLMKKKTINASLHGYVKYYLLSFVAIF